MALSGTRAIAWEAAFPRTARALAHALTLDEVAEAIFQHTGPALGAQSIALWLCEDRADPDVGGPFASTPATNASPFTDPTAPGAGSGEPRPSADLLRFVGGTGFVEGVSDTVAEIALADDLPAGDAIGSHAPVWYRSRAERDERWPSLRRVDTESESTVVLPLEARERTVGCLSIGFAEVRDFAPQEIAGLVAVAEHCALALDRAMLFDTERSGRETLEFLAEGTRLMVSALEPAQVLRALVRLAVPRLAPWCAVYVSDHHAEGGPVLRRVAIEIAGNSGLSERIRSVKPVSVDADVPLARAYRTNEVQIVPSAAPDEVARTTATTDRAVVAAIGWGTALVLPIRAEGRPIGVMSLVLERGSDIRRPSLRHAADGLAARAGVALQNAERHRLQVETIETLAAALLPNRLPELAGVSIAARYVSAAGMVCGDWYEAELIRDGNLLVGVGDACGHGVPAAAMMSEVRNGARGLAMADRSPGELLDHLSRLLETGTDDSAVITDAPPRIATALYGVFDPPTGVLLWASAGHLAPLVVHPGGQVELLEGRPGLPLGVEGRPHEDRVVKIDPGSSFILYTDGLVERRGQGLDAGMDRLRSLVAGVAARSPSGIVDAVMAELAVEPSDDCCMIVVRRDDAAPAAS